MRRRRDAKQPSQPEGLEQRVRHLELMVEELQDAHYARARKVDSDIAALRRLAEPDEVARRLAADARRRGL